MVSPAGIAHYDCLSLTASLLNSTGWYMSFVDIFICDMDYS